MIFSSYFARALRWRVFVAPIKAASLRNIFVSTLIGFSSVALLGRPGELTRPLLISQKEGVSLSSQLAAWALERLFDGLTMGILIGGAIVLFPPVNGAGSQNERLLGILKTAGITLFAGSIFMVVVLSQFRRRSRMIMNVLLWIMRAIPQRFREKIQSTVAKVIQSFSEGLASIETASRFGICLAYSAMVWLPLVVTYWSVNRAFDAPMNQLNLGASVMVLAITAAGSIAQLPGVGGGAQIASVLAYTQLFNIPLEIASTAAIVLWVLCFMIVLIPGIPLAAREGLSWKQLRAIARGGSDDGNAISATPMEIK